MVQVAAYLKRLARVGLPVYAVIAVGVLKMSGSGIAAVLWALPLTIAALGVVTLLYSAIVQELGVPLSEVWRLPDEQIVELEGAPDGAAVWIREVASALPVPVTVTDSERGLELSTKRTAWRGAAKVSVRVRALNDERCEVLLTAAPAKLIDNGTARAVAYAVASALCERSRLASPG